MLDTSHYNHYNDNSEASLHNYAIDDTLRSPMLDTSHYNHYNDNSKASLHNYAINNTLRSPVLDTSHYDDNGKASLHNYAINDTLCSPVLDTHDHDDYREAIRNHTICSPLLEPKITDHNPIYPNNWPNHHNGAWTTIRLCTKKSLLSNSDRMQHLYRMQGQCSQQADLPGGSRI
ncbi:uncharacterized protein LOC115441880 [Manduca sexta]|uniref:uncharacterized protein LOC115441880 n=1 Tax=Manduca sexta TaxID=7130 RepID=UPI00188EAE36|nr:uncharacterized protein LOC115441880 [Manduca sexta]